MKSFRTSPSLLCGALLTAIFHHLVQDNAVGQLHGEPILIHGNFLHIVVALDPYLLVRDQVLDDHVRHVVAVSVPFLVKPVHGGKEHLDKFDFPIVGADGDVVVVRPGGNGPYPVLVLAERFQANALLGPKRRFVVAPPDDQVLAVPTVLETARVKADLPVLLDLHVLVLLLSTPKFNQNLVIGCDMLRPQVWCG